MLLFAWLFLFVSSALAGGASSRPSASMMRSYANLHRSLLQPLNLHSDQPAIVAPVGPPWRGPNRIADMQNYLRHLYNHDAYIDPDAGAHLTTLRSNMRWIINHPNDPRIGDYQRGLIATLEEEAQHATFNMQNALHPVNVRAQHFTAIRSLADKVNGVVGVIRAGSNSERLTSHLEQADQDRFAHAFEILYSEKELLSAATRLATSIPRLN